MWVEAVNDKVVQLVPQQVSADFRFDADTTLEKMKGKSISSLLIIADTEEGRLEIEGNCNAGEALVLMERARHDIVFGDDE